MTDLSSTHPPSTPVRSRRLRMPAAFSAATLALATVVVILHSSQAQAAAGTLAVDAVGDFQSEVGCGGDWVTDCAGTKLADADGDGVYTWTTTAIPAGSWQSKVTIGGTWSENYGAGGAAGGANIAFTVPSAGATTSFSYNAGSHLLTVRTPGTLAVDAVGDFQSEVGCGGDWVTDCAKTKLTDPDGDGVYTWTTTAIPAGSWQSKVTIGGSWNENYGAGGAAGGANIAFTVPSAGASETFSYNSGTHLLTESAGSAPTPTTAAPTTAAPTTAAPTPTSTATLPATTMPNTLGSYYTAANTTFRIWSPDSSNVTVTVNGASHALSPITLTGYSNVYQAVVSGDLKDKPYQFYVNGTAVRDPYAEMVNPGTTQGIVLNDTDTPPTSGGWAATPALAHREDSVLYELDVRDFTIDPSSGVDAAKRGKYLGLVQTGTTNNGVKTGIDHLKELGVTTVHLMPTYDFSSTLPNWGYDPLNYNVPEEQFSQFTSPEDRIREFKDMINGFHQNGIRVVLDVVYNHTVSKDVLGGITGKYYTPDDYSGTGNSLDDSQPMVSRMIRDSLEHWVKTYNVDGFRFDLMGVFHHTDVQSWGTYLTSTYPSRNLLLYGEPWMGSGSPATESDYVRYGTVASMQDGHIGVFNGAFRDAIKGGTKDAVMAYMGGAGSASSIVTGMRGSPLATKSTAVLPDVWNPAFTYDPEETINYVSAHDDLNLYDKITYSGAGGGAAGRAGQIDKFAIGIVLTAQGIPFLSEGDEFLHSKVVNGDYGPAMNSYNAPDSVNAIHWGDKVTNAAVYKFYKDAIALRKSTPALRLTSWDAVHHQVSTAISGSVVTTSISSSAAAPTSYDTVVVDNPTSSSYTATLPAGTWTKVLDATGAVSATGTTCAPQSVTVFKRS